MTRAFSSSWRIRPILTLAVLLLGLAHTAAYAGKPTIAVLGLEVVDPTGQIDQASTMFAKDLTDALRSRAKLPSGPYQFAPGSEKELIDEKLIKNCDNEAIACMSQIGKDLGADFLIYGRLEHKGDSYAVTINLLNIGKKKFEKAKTPLMVPNTKDATAIQSAAKRAYNDLVGVQESGTLVVRTNAERGTVLLDDEQKAALNSGTATISAPEGRYRLAVEADGFQRSAEIVVTVRSGETTTQPVTLVEATKGVDEIKHEITGTTSTTKTNVWKPAFVASVAVGVVSGGVWGWAFYKERSAADKVTKQATGLDEGNCTGAGSDALKAADSNFADACRYRGYTTYGIIGTSLSVVAVAFTGYMAFGRGSSETAGPATTAGRRARKRPFSVTPIVQAGGGGATFRLDW